MHKIRRFLMVALIAVGIGVILYPWLRAAYFNAMQKELINSWRDNVASGEINPDATVYYVPRGWSNSTVVIGGGNAENDIWDEDINPSVNLEYLHNNMQGVLTIEKIKLTSPILKSVSISNLNIAICSAVEWNRMGQSGNYVLAGHNSRIYGRHFNRLKELETGDVIVLDDGFDEYTYVVTDVFTVSPSDVWVMHDDGERKLLTLITCYYGTTPTGRLIVRAEMQA